MPKILMACIQPYWSCLQLGSQHLARQFAKSGWDVFYLSAPVTPLHLPRLSNSEVRSRFKSSFCKPSSHENGRIQAYAPFALIAPDGRPILSDPLVTLNWYRTIIPALQKTLARAGADRVNLLYIDNLSYHFLLDYVQHDKSVLRVMDIHEHFPGWQGKAGRLAQKIASRAEITVYSAKGLKPYVEGLSPRQTLLVPNGVDFEFFQSLNTAQKAPHPLLSSIPGPIFLYTGILDSRLDWELILDAANDLPRVSFVLAGPEATHLRQASWPANVHFPGPVAHSELPQLMASAAAGIIPFDIQNRLELIQGIRPLKLLEYLAAGLPVICARWPEVEAMQSPAWLYDNKQEFVQLVHKAIQQQGFDPAVNKDYARQFDWETSYRLLTAALHQT